MARTVAIGAQDFEKIIENNDFYVDKTSFIKEWWENRDTVTLITRPRRFGKTLTMSMLNSFFSIQYAGRSDLFEGLSIWKEEKYRKLQGTYPVLSLSFANIKENTYRKTCRELYKLIVREYRKNVFLTKSPALLQAEKDSIRDIAAGKLDLDDIGSSLNLLSEYLYRHYDKKVIILLDEYDTPMQEAYINGYWDELAEFTRGLFNSTFKTNLSLERGLMTGITRVSKESIFSDLNNLKVITTTSKKYATSFGFTEAEVFQALEEFGLESQMDSVKKWYDGFSFGKHLHIYNPWSIINFLDEEEFQNYWVNTSSNTLVGKLIQKGSRTVKIAMEDLLNGMTYKTPLDEEIVFNQLDHDENAVWSFLLASGYLKVVDVIKDYESDDTEYELALTNTEVKRMLKKIIRSWFPKGGEIGYDTFEKALLNGDLTEMNMQMSEIFLNTFSCFDTGRRLSGKSEPERFYHGFVLGLLVNLRQRYHITSNRESGKGRYDVMLSPLEAGKDAIILEFKTCDAAVDKNLKDTVKAALQQIIDKRYAASLEAEGVNRSNIRIYGFAFSGKEVLIDGGYINDFEKSYPKQEHSDGTY